MPLALLTAPAASAAVAPPPPESVTSSPGCAGLMVSYYNHFFGALSPSGNENASVGPGTGFSPKTSEKIRGDRDAHC